MASYFEKGLSNTIPSKILGLPDYVRLVKDDVQIEKYDKIRSMRANGNVEYKTLKKNLPYITPSVILKERKLQTPFEIRENLIQFTGFFYFDIDEFPEEYSVYTYKEYIISRYSHIVSFVCLSSSLGGVSILIKVTNEVTVQNFQNIWDTIKFSILKDEKVDENCQGMGRAMLLSYDKDVYTNYENCITINDITEYEQKIEVDPITSSSYNKVKAYFSGTTKDDSNYTRYHIYSIEEVLATIKTKTIVPVTNPVVEFREEMVLEPYIPNIIVDGKKHKTYYILLQQWLYLNQDVQLDYIFSYLFYINNTRAKPKMEMKEMLRMFNSVTDKIKKTGRYDIEPKIRRIHWNLNNKELTGKMKETIAKSLNGAYERQTTIKKIQDAKSELIINGMKVTNRAIAEMIKMNINTVGKRINDNPIDMDDEVSLWN